MNDIKGKMPSITGLATTSALNVAKYEIPKAGDLVKLVIFLIFSKIREEF